MTATDSIRDKDRGRTAGTPSAISLEGWKDVLWRTWTSFNENQVKLIAAGTTFYLLLGLFPALAALVATYGLFADPTRILETLSMLSGVLPGDAVGIIETQLNSLIAQKSSTLTFAFALGLGFALWSANSGVKGLFEALNVVFEEVEKRSFVWLTFVSFLFTIGAIVLVGLAIFVVGVVPAILAFVGLGGSTEVAVSLLRWPSLFVVAAFAITLLYRHGPSREPAKWRWVTWGSTLAAAVWLAASVAFSWYLANFANYNAMYGSLGAVVGFMMWTWVSCMVLIVGAVLDAETEHQTLRDTTTGPPKPIGARGATMADTIGRNRHGIPVEDEAHVDAALYGGVSSRAGKSSRKSAGPLLLLVLGVAFLLGARGSGR